MQPKERVAAVRVLRGVVWGLFLLSVLALGIGAAKAETIAATSGSTAAVTKWQWSQERTTCAQACTDASNAYGSGGATCGGFHAWYDAANHVNGVFVTCNRNSNGTFLDKIWQKYSCASGTLTVAADGLSATCSTGTYSCPSGQGWTLNGANCTRPDCAAGQTRMNTGGSCVTACTKGPNEQVGTGRYGFAYPQPSGVTWCVSGCTVYPGGTGVVDGAVKYQYAFVNGSGGAASSCVAGGEVVPNVNAQSGESLQNSAVGACISSGQGFGTVNGNVVCTGPTTTIDQQKYKDSATPASGPASTTEKTVTTVCNTAGACTQTTTTNVTSGGSGPGGTGPGSTTAPGAGSGKEESKAAFCTENPNASQCKETQQGAAATVTGLYTKGTKTVSDVVGTFKTAIQGAGFYQAASNYFTTSLPSGSCSGMSVDVAPPLGAAWHIDLGTYLCGGSAATLYSLLGIGVMLAAGWVAFRIAIL